MTNSLTSEGDVPAPRSGFGIVSLDISRLFKIVFFLLLAVLTVGGCRRNSVASRRARVVALVAKVEAEQATQQAADPIVVPPDYPSAFRRFAYDLDAPSSWKEETDRLQAKLDSGAIANEAFLIAQLNSADESTRYLACYELQFVKNKRVNEAVLKLAQSTPSVMTRMSAIESLGHLGDPSSIPYIQSVLTEPYHSESTRAITAYYRIDPKAAVPAFKKRLGEATGPSAVRATIAMRTMGVYILDSDPAKESAYVLGLVKDLGDHGGTSKSLAELEKAAIAKQHPTRLMKSEP